MVLYKLLYWRSYKTAWANRGPVCVAVKELKLSYHNSEPCHSIRIRICIWYPPLSLSLGSQGLEDPPGRDAVAGGSAGGNSCHQRLGSLQSAIGASL